MRVSDLAIERGVYRNRLHNANLREWQRATSATRIQNFGSGYVADRIGSSLNAGTARSITIARSTDVPTDLLFAEEYSMQVTNNTVYNPSAGEFILPFRHIIEANFCHDLSGQNITFGIWIWSDVSRTVPVSFHSGDNSSSYVSAFGLSAGWGFYTKTVNVPFTIVPSTDWGLRVYVGSVAGTTYQAANLDVWSGASLFSHASMTNWASTTGVKLRFGQHQLRLGVWSPDEMVRSFSLFSGMNADEEFESLKRYFEKSYARQIPVGTITDIGLTRTFMRSTAQSDAQLRYSVEKRINPIFNTYSPATGAVGTVRNNSGPGDAASLLYPLTNGTINVPYVDTLIVVAADSDIRFHWTADAEF